MANAAGAASRQAEAARLYNELLRRQPEFYAARNNYADLLLQAGCRDRAKRVFEPVVRALPEISGSLGEALRDTEKAIRDSASADACLLP